MGGSEDVVIEKLSAATREVKDLLGELDRTLSAVYAPEQRHALALEALFQPHVRFFLARLGDAAVGCGGVAFYAGFAEVKRMYVRPLARGRGVAQAILARIEVETRQAEQVLLRLETGERQIAAMRLYARAGFQRCAAFGDYATMSAAAIATSVFFEKRLAGSAGARTRAPL